MPRAMPRDTPIAVFVGVTPGRTVRPVGGFETRPYVRRSRGRYGLEEHATLRACSLMGAGDGDPLPRGKHGGRVPLVQGPRQGCGRRTEDHCQRRRFLPLLLRRGHRGRVLELPLFGGSHLSYVAQIFERLPKTYRRGDDGRWSGVELERATGASSPAPT
jgi:hypothetical protein